jgi:non-homologous end joining protein Ku
LRELLEAKAEGRELPEPEEAETETPVIDLMEALRASVAASSGEGSKGKKKPAAKKTAASQKKRAATG